MDLQSFFTSPFPLSRLPVAFLNVVCEMAPYLLLGFLIAGVLHVFVPQKFYANYCRCYGRHCWEFPFHCVRAV